MPNVFLERYLIWSRSLANTGNHRSLAYTRRLVMIIQDTNKQEIQCLGQMPNELGIGKEQRGGGK